MTRTRKSPGEHAGRPGRANLFVNVPFTREQLEDIDELLARVNASPARRWTPHTRTSLLKELIGRGVVSTEAELSASPAPPTSPASPTTEAPPARP